LHDIALQGFAPLGVVLHGFSLRGVELQDHAPLGVVLQGMVLPGIAPSGLAWNDNSQHGSALLVSLRNSNLTNFHICLLSIVKPKFKQTDMEKLRLFKGINALHA